jgi:Fe2+ transport system protein FeoA
MITLPRPRRDRPLPAHRAPDPDPAAASPAAGRAPLGTEHALAEAPLGGRVTVVRILGDASLRSRLVGLGIAPGVDITLAGGHAGRPRVVGLNGCRLAIDHRTAGSVLVRPATASCEGLDA